MATHIDVSENNIFNTDAGIILRQILASLIAGITTEVKQTDDHSNISVAVISTDTGLKFTFTLPSATAVAGAIQADIAMSDVSVNPVQNRIIKAYVDGKFWTGTAAEYALLADDTDIICFLSDTNVIMFNGESYSLNAHVHGNLTNEGAIGALADMVIMTGTDGVLEAVTLEALKELLGSSSGLNLLHNGEFVAPFNTKGQTIYNTAGESLDRWNLLAGTLTANADYATLSQAAINTAQFKQILPTNTYDRLMGQPITLSMLLADDVTVYSATGVIDGAATEIISIPLTNNYTFKLVVDNATKVVHVVVAGGATVAAINMFRAKLELGTSSSIEDGVTDAALDWARIKTYDINGAVIEGAYVRYDAAMTLDATQQARVRTSINAAAPGDIPTTPGAVGAEPAFLAFSDVAVGTSGWAVYTAAAGDETTIQGLGYLYRKAITLTGVTATGMTLILVPSPNLYNCGASICDCMTQAANTGYIYAMTTPTAEFTLRKVLAIAR